MEVQQLQLPPMITGLPYVPPIEQLQSLLPFLYNFNGSTNGTAEDVDFVFDQRVLTIITQAARNASIHFKMFVEDASVSMDSISVSTARTIATFDSAVVTLSSVIPALTEVADTLKESIDACKSRFIFVNAALCLMLVALCINMVVGSITKLFCCCVSSDDTSTEESSSSSSSSSSSPKKKRRKPVPQKRKKTQTQSVKLAKTAASRRTGGVTLAPGPGSARPSASAPFSAGAGSTDLSDPSAAYWRQQQRSPIMPQSAPSPTPYGGRVSPYGVQYAGDPAQGYG